MLNLTTLWISQSTDLVRGGIDTGCMACRCHAALCMSVGTQDRLPFSEGRVGSGFDPARRGAVVHFEDLKPGPLKAAAAVFALDFWISQVEIAVFLKVTSIKAKAVSSKLHAKPRPAANSPQDLDLSISRLLEVKTCPSSKSWTYMIPCHFTSYFCPESQDVTKA